MGLAIETDVPWCVDREEAKAHFLRNPTFNVWAPEVLDLYIQYGLVDIPPSEGGGVRLKMSSFQASVP
jgi:hypothetical protein